ncbi:MAG TPA: M48 family metallopeptidase, partial [Candidatus Saccharibacteria bacterium]|nr:M48 family metallopeptidase [Candidatus Saccharibacteria bacterium]
QIGKSHTLYIKPSASLRAEKQKRHIILYLPHNINPSDTSVAQTLRPHIITALRTEAKSHLPKRLDWLAKQYGFTYEKVRFSHASGRWGSCSSQGTISLNIALMKLPFELIDYVIIHELAHTVHMNHSQDFWNLVARADPNYKKHRASLRKEMPAV